MPTTENIEKILEIKVKYADAVKGIAEYNRSITQLKARERELKDAYAEGVITAKQMREEIAAGSLQMTQQKEALRTLTKEVQNNMRQEQQKEGSLKSLRAELSNLTKQYDELSREERQGAKGDEMRQHLNRVTTELKQAEEETQRYYRNVGNYGNALKPMRQELRELTMQLAEMERNGLRGSEAYNEIAKRAGQLKDNMADARREINRYSSDIRGLESALDIVKTATTAWQVYAGAMNAFGLESEEAMQAMRKLQGIMAITNGLKQLGTQLTNNETASYKAYHAVLRMLGIEKQKDIVTTQAETAAQTASATAMTASAGAAKILRTALAALGIGALIAGIVALVSYWDEVKAFFGGISEEAERAAKYQSELNEIEKDAAKIYAKNAAEITYYTQRVTEFNGTKEDEKKLVGELNSKYGQSFGVYKTLDQWKEQLIKRGNAYCEMMMLEAQAQAVLMKYAEAYTIVLEEQNKLRSAQKYSLSTDLFKGDGDAYGKYLDEQERQVKMQRQAIQRAEADAKRWMDEYMKLMGRANKIAAENSFNPIGESSTPKSTTRKTGKTGSTKNDAEKEAKELLDITRKTEDQLTQLITDKYKQREREINLSYDRQKEDIEIKIKQLKKTQVKEAEELGKQLDNIEKLRERDLTALRNEFNAEQIQKEQERIQKMLEVVEAGSREELMLRLDGLRATLDAENNAIDTSTATEEEKFEQRRLAFEKYLHDRNELISDYDERLAEQRAQAVANDFQQRINDAFGNELETLRIQYEQKQLLMEEAQQKEGETLEAFNARKLQLESDYLNAKKALADKEREIEQAKYDFAAAIAGGLAGVFESLGESNTAFAKLSKVLALAEIAINTGKAVAAGIAQAQAVPFPANIGAIATTISAILSGMASAIKAVKSAKFARGGLVVGEGTGTSDSIPARLSNGESVMTAQATSMFSPLLSAVNQLGGGIPIVAQTPSQQMGEDMLASAVAKGMSYAPAPVVSVREITNVSNRVQAIEDLATI